MTKAYDWWLEGRSYAPGGYQARMRERSYDPIFRLAGSRVKGDYAPYIFRVLKALRPICADSHVEQYRKDIHAVAAVGYSVATVANMLDASGFSSIDKAGWFSDAGTYNCVKTDDGLFVHRDDTWECGRCGGLFSTDADIHVVHVHRNSSQDWCEECGTSHSFYCCVSEESYSDSDFNGGNLCDGGGIICEEIVESRGYIFSERRGGWYFPTYRDSDGDIPAYHSQKRNWPQIAIANRSLRPWYGLEIELEFPGPEARTEFWREHLDGDPDFLGEHDSSLSEECGMEIVSRPFNIEELRDSAGPLRKLCDRLVDVGAEAGTDHDYGCHVNLNWHWMSPNHRFRLVTFICSFKPMSEFVSQRAESSYAAYATSAAMKYRAVHARNPQVAEFRCFSGTPDYAALMSYVEYVDAAIEWTRDPDRPAHESFAREFRFWVVANSSRWPYLATRFSPRHHKDPPCASPSSNLVTAPSQMLLFAPASSTTPMVQASPSPTLPCPI